MCEAVVITEEHTKEGREGIWERNKIIIITLEK